MIGLPHSGLNSRSASQTILVVEDEASVLENIVELLEAEGFSVLTARNGEEAYRLVLDEKPDLILSDIRLPRLDGMGLLSRLTKTHAIANIPFIFLTAMTTREDQRAGMELGADDYITKPFTRKDLLDAVQRRLEKHQAIQAEAVKENVNSNQYLAQVMPFEMIQPLMHILALADDLMKMRGGAPEGDGVYAAGQSIRREAEVLLHTVDDYRYFYSMLVGPEMGVRKEEMESVVSAKPVIEELAQSLFWEYHRQEDLRLVMQDAEIAANEAIYTRVVEELLRVVLSGTRAGEVVEVEGSVFACQSMYRLAIIGPKSFLSDEQADWLRNAEAVGMKEYSQIGIGLILARKLVEVMHGGLSVSMREDGRLSLDVFLRLVSSGSDK